MTSSDFSAPARPTRRALGALGVLLVAQAVLYLWTLSRNGWANSFYSAAVQAGSTSWKAFFFGSSDGANSITVDKTPLALWPQEIAVRLFGLNSWSILVPEVLMGLASVALLWATVRRWYGDTAGLLAGLVLALTPAAVLMFRFNNPDALLVLLSVAAVWATARGVEDGRIRWAIAAGAFVGLGFLAKQLQVVLVVPALVVVVLLAARGGVLRRIGHLAAAGAAAVVAAGWYIAAVELWPASSRPYIGGSQNNSLVELTLGYNGLGRLNGDETGSVGGGGMRGGMPEGMAGGMPPGGPGGGGGGGMWGQTGITRMFDGQAGGQASWLLPAALLLLVVGIVLAGRTGRRDLRRAGLVMFGTWTVTTWLVFSFMAGIFHDYYTVALAAPIAGTVAAGAAILWADRTRLVAVLTGAVALAGSAVWAFVLLGRSPDFVPWLRWCVLVLGVLAALALLAVGVLRRRGPGMRRLAAGVLADGGIALAAGPAAYAVDTVTTAKTGSIITAGPEVAGGHGPGGGGPGGRGGRDGGRDGGGMRGGMPGMQNSGMGTPPGGTGGMAAAGGAGGMGGPGGGAGGPGGLLNSPTVGAELKALLEADADRYTWVAATTGAQQASGYQLTTQKPVMPIGGFNGSDPSPTLEQFQQYAREGRIHYYIGGGGAPGGGGAMGVEGESPSSQISTWVTENYTARTVDGVTVYDLTAPKG